MLPEAMSALVGCHATALTSPPWPTSVASAEEASRLFPKSHTFTVPSSEHDAYFSSEGANERPCTASLWAPTILRTKTRELLLK